MLQRKKIAILLTTEKDYLRISENYKKNNKLFKIKTEINNKNQFVEEIKKLYESDKIFFSIYNYNFII